MSVSSGSGMKSDLDSELGKAVVSAEEDETSQESSSFDNNHTGNGPLEGGTGTIDTESMDTQSPGGSSTGGMVGGSCSKEDSSDADDKSEITVVSPLGLSEVTATPYYSHFSILV